MLGKISFFGKISRLYYMIFILYSAIRTANKNRGNHIIDAVMMILLVLATVIIILDRTGFSLRRNKIKVRDLIKILICAFLLILINVCIDTLRSNSCSGSEIIFGILGYAFLVTVGILLGAFMFLLILKSEFAGFFFKKSYEIIKKWNYYVELTQTFMKFELELDYRKDHKLKNFQLFKHFLLELFFVHVVFSVILTSNAPFFLSLQAISRFLLNNIIFFAFLPLYSVFFLFSIVGLKWNKKFMRVSIFHKFVSLAAIVIAVMKINKGIMFEILLYGTYHFLFVYGISLGLLLLKEHSANKMEKYLISKRHEFKSFLKIRFKRKIEYPFMIHLPLPD